MNTINDLQQITKDSIAILADKARENIIQNKYLLEKINIFKNEIITVKNLINSFWLNSNQPKIKNIIASKYKEQLALFNSNLKEEINKGQQKLKVLHKNSLMLPDLFSYCADSIFHVFSSLLWQSAEAEEMLLPV